MVVNLSRKSVVEVIGAGFEHSPKSPVFNNLNFNVTDNEVLSILGPNGCGKTTLLRCIMGMLCLKEGAIHINGKEMRKAQKDRNIPNMGYVPQSHGMTFPYTVFEMVLMGRARYIGMFSTPTYKDIEIARESLKTIGISHLERRAFSEISGGEKQLVLIARALASKTKILVFDEPTSALDYKNQYHILELIHQLTHKNGLTIIMATHHPEHALYISDKILLMGNNDSTEYFFGNVRETLTENNLSKIYGVHAKIVSIPHGKDHLKGIIPIINLSKSGLHN